MDMYKSEEVLFSARPARDWYDAFPVGNGRIGAMVPGGTETERIALNHENLWRGENRNRVAGSKVECLREIRRLLLSGEYTRADKMARERLSADENRIQPYQPAADLKVCFPGHDFKKISDGYRRALDLSRGVATVSYNLKNTVFSREVFASAVDSVIAVSCRASAARKLDATIEMERIEDTDCMISRGIDGNIIGLYGQFPEGISFAVEALVICKEGRLAPVSGYLKVEGASGLDLLVSVETGFNRERVNRMCRDRLDGLNADYKYLLRRHENEHRDFFNRVRVAVEVDSDRSGIPLEVRHDEMKRKTDPGLVALFFQFGRYLLMSSSRKCEQPANLQGIWNKELKPAWKCDFHHDINLQMNYWPAEICNLKECVEPLVSYLMKSMPEGTKVARDRYGCSGLFLPVKNDIWGQATPESGNWNIWTGAAAWLSRYLWWHYEYHLDLEFLRDKAYPFLKATAEFYSDYLVRDDKGSLVPAPSQSPENWYVAQDGNPAAVCAGATNELILVREVFERCLEASKVLGIDEELGEGWRNVLYELAPFRVGAGGQLQEWEEDFKECEPGHRHFSHLIGVWPGEMMNDENNPGLAEAAKVSLKRRLASGEGAARGAGSAGWSCAHAAGLMARFGEGNEAYRLLEKMIGNLSKHNLLSFKYKQLFQIECLLGAAAVCAAMLLQSRNGKIYLLPALPDAWFSGKAEGLLAKGGFVFSLEWKEKELVKVSVFSRKGKVCNVYLSSSRMKVTAGGREVSSEFKGGTLSWETKAGIMYELV